MKIEKEILQKKKRIEKKKNTNKYCDFQRFEKLLFVEGKLSGGFKTWPPSKKKASPPALMINYITCRCLSACLASVLPCCFPPAWLLPCLLAVVLSVSFSPLLCYCLTNYYNTSNNPFNTLIIAYITFDSIIIPIL